MTQEFCIQTLHARYESGDLTPSALVESIHQKIDSIDNPHIWIHLLTREELAPFLENLAERSPKDLPLYGIPFAIKDNIDLA